MQWTYVDQTLPEKWIGRSSRWQVFFKIGAPKNFAIFTGKHLYWSLFLTKLQASRSATLLKKRQHWCFPVNMAEFLRTPFFHRIKFSRVEQRTEYISLTSCQVAIFKGSERYLSCIPEESRKNSKATCLHFAAVLINQFIHVFFYYFYSLLLQMFAVI